MIRKNETEAEAVTPWMTTKEVAEYVSVSVGTVRNWVSARYIPFVRRGRVVRFHRDEIDKWLRINPCPGRATIAMQQTENGGT